MSWRDIIKAKELTPKQKKLDNNHNGVIDAQDFYIMNEKIDKSNGNLMSEDPHNEKSVRLYHKEELPTDMEKFGYAKEQCPTCGNLFANQRVLDRHEIEAHGSTRRGPATR